ncbi:hypothetical protein P053_00789 [Brucella abortus 01-4165]|nr:hypothetical protein DK48_1054 [Brucella abortus]AIJ60607.1 hypothetical protein DK53_1048 [Brucella abortus bv. 9 str. C68]AIJ63532.1 hypothetical protein DO74_824 [Brucella abortus bv. 6 str. 870]AIJ92333.1 hypothetical protein DK55_1065 [Brucella abortus bv. 2 str. 86/8/59]EHR10872.1 hypothetical protein M19_01323 [Brucella abortus bv. 1 str. NI474]EHR14551.1 hypothetical protein M17_00526 [Brucella abortus bv. 1 str. NI435a]EHR15165.1 hypothetical protein M1A_00526 [Brucella abortus bv
MIAVDPAARIHQHNISRLIELFAICAMRQCGGCTEGNDAERRSTPCTQCAVLLANETHHLAGRNARLYHRMRPAVYFERKIHRILDDSDFVLGFADTLLAD